MFKFNFLPDNEEDNKNTHLEQPEITYFGSKEIVPKNTPNLIDSILKEVETKIIKSSDTDIKYLCSNSLIDFLKSQNLEETIIKAEQSHTDLLPAVYEGGLKIWECTYDILNYFKETQTDFKDKIVLDLGCGVGILGIYSLLKGATSWFQDYNEDVIENITIPNVLLNLDTFLKKSKFFSGDWNSFVEIMEEKYPGDKFDYIITSETIYNTNYYTKLHLVFEKLLKKDGVVFLAAKSFYFGVGGGVHLFQNVIDSKKIFKYTSCWQSTEGVKREILKLNFL